jgi:hypothetical protein
MAVPQHSDSSTRRVAPSGRHDADDVTIRPRMGTRTHPRSRNQSRGLSTRSPTPALRLWRREIARGQRSTTEFDDLWRAATCEMRAVEFELDGLPTIARQYRADARQFLQAMLKETA